MPVENDDRTVTVVLTGGPCAGKTTALPAIADRFAAFGWKVLVAPEACTLLTNCGVDRTAFTPDMGEAFQCAVMAAQIAVEDGLRRIARAMPGRHLILLDRGVMDGAAFLPAEHWARVEASVGRRRTELRDARYDGVIHMVTAAIGAPEHYTLANNPARIETPEEATVSDRRLLRVWTGHPHLRVIDNRGDFADKIRRTVEAVCDLAGVPVPVERERKFLLSGVPELPSGLAETFEIEQIYLTSREPGDEERVRRRTHGGASLLYHTVKRRIRDGERMEVERLVGEAEFSALLSRRDPSRAPVRKGRHCFMHAERHFELDVYRSPRAGLAVLEVEVASLDETVELPPFLRVEREVTDDPAYANAAIAASQGASS